MEFKIFRAARVICILLLFLNLSYLVDEFLAPEAGREILSAVKWQAYRDGQEETWFILNNGRAITVDYRAEAPETPCDVEVYLTPIYHGVKGIKYDFKVLSKDSSELIKMTNKLGEPDSPRSVNLIFNIVALLIIAAALFLKQMEYAVGLTVFVIVLSAVNYWVLH